jgi:hypothetical protein
VVRNRPLHRLPDPPRRVGGELVSAAPVELLDGAVQPERSLLDEIEERNTETAVALRDRHDEAQVGLDHAPLRGRVAALDALREHDLFRGGQQLVPTDVGEEQLQAVGRAGDRLRRLQPRCLRLRRLLGVGLRSDRSGGADLEPDALELRRQLLDLLIVEVELDGERLQLGLLQVAALLRSLDEGARLVGLEQLVELVLAQVSVLSGRRCIGCDNRPSHSTREVLSMPGGSFGPGLSSLRTVARSELFRRGRFCFLLFRLCPDGKVEFDLPFLV